MSAKQQDEFLTKVYSQPVKCPSCGKDHSYVEARGSSNWGIDAPAICPETGDILKVEVALLGGEYFFTLHEAKGREMSREEEIEWQQLDDNMDWMSDEQIKYEGDKIREKYKNK